MSNGNSYGLAATSVLGWVYYPSGEPRRASEAILVAPVFAWNACMTLFGIMSCSRSVDVSSLRETL